MPIEGFGILHRPVKYVTGTHRFGELSISSPHSKWPRTIQPTAGPFFPFRRQPMGRAHASVTANWFEYAQPPEERR
jgi:hypothetical protein